MIFFSYYFFFRKYNLCVPRLCLSYNALIISDDIIGKTILLYHQHVWICCGRTNPLLSSEETAAARDHNVATVRHSIR